MSFDKDNSLQRQMAEAEALIAQVEGMAGSPAGERVQRVVNLVLDLHRDALKRMIRSIKQSGQAGDALLAVLAEDELVAQLLLLHDLHPMGMPERVAGAVAKVRPYLQSHGGDVELVGIADGSASLRMQGSCGGCPAMANSLKLVIEKALYDAAPDLAGVHVEAPAQPAVSE